MGGDHGYTAMWMDLIPLNCNLKLFKTVAFMLHIVYHTHTHTKRIVFPLLYCRVIIGEQMLSRNDVQIPLNLGGPMNSSHQWEVCRNIISHFCIKAPEKQ